MTTLTPSSAQAGWLPGAAGLLEVAWAVGMKCANGYSRPLPILLVLAVALASFALPGLAMKALPVGTAYAAWVGIGAAGAALLGAVPFGEPATLARVGCVLLIVAGVVGLMLIDG